MTPLQRDEIMARLRAGWDKPLSDAVESLWFDKLNPLDFGRARRTIETLIDTRARQPAWSDFREAYQLTRGYSSGPPPRECGICDDGFVNVPCEVDCTMTDHSVTRCPNGCLPLTPEERNAKIERDIRDYRDRRTRERERVGAARDPSEPHGGIEEEPF